MRLIFILILFLFCGHKTYSQDVIYLKNNGDSIICKIIEDKISSLRYKLLNSPDSLIFEINQEDYEYYVDRPEAFVMDKSQETEHVIFSKDIIYLKNDSDSIICRIVDDKISFLYYKLWDTTDTTTYRISQVEYDYYINNPDKIIDNKTNTTNQIKLPSDNNIPVLDIGAGIGLDYGGLFGLKVTFNPSRYGSLIFSVGSAIISAGVNAGIQFYIWPHIPKYAVRPHLKVMCGTNAVIIVNGIPALNKTYAGITPGGGIELRFGQKRNYGFDFDLCFPIRSKEFKHDYDRIKSNKLIIIQDTQALTISAGIHFEI